MSETYRKNMVAIDHDRSTIEEGLLAADLYPGTLCKPLSATDTIAAVSTASLGGERWVLLEDSFLGNDAATLIASGEYGRLLHVKSGQRCLARIKLGVTTTVDAKLAFHSNGTLKLAAAATSDTPADVVVFVALEAVVSPGSGTAILCTVRAV